MVDDVIERHYRAAGPAARQGSEPTIVAGRHAIFDVTIDDRRI